MHPNVQSRENDQAPGARSLRWLVILPLLFGCLIVALVWPRFETPPETEPESAASRNGPRWKLRNHSPAPAVRSPEVAAPPAPALPVQTPPSARKSPVVATPVQPEPVAEPIMQNTVASSPPPNNKFVSAGTGPVAGELTETGVISGRAMLQGTPPPESPIGFDPTCGRLRTNTATTHRYVVSASHGLADVFVQIKDLPATASPQPLEAVLINQAGCEFTPYILAVHTGQSILVRNSDPVLHNLHVKPAAAKNIEDYVKFFGKREVNVAQPPRTPDYEFVFHAPEPFVTVQCDVHPWMFAYVCVADHPWFALTDKEGNYRLPPLPPGEYVIEATHRKAGTLTRRVNVRSGRAVRVTENFTFNAK